MELKPIEPISFRNAPKQGVDHPHYVDSDPGHSDHAIAFADNPNPRQQHLPISLPHHPPIDDSNRNLLNHKDQPYRRLTAAAQQEHLLSQIERLEHEHFALARNFTANGLMHAWVIEQDETPQQAHRRYMHERKLAVEAELDRLYAEHDEAIKNGELELETLHAWHNLTTEAARIIKESKEN